MLCRAIGFYQACNESLISTASRKKNNFAVRKVQLRGNTLS